MQSIIYEPRKFSNFTTFLRSDLKKIKNELNNFISNNKIYNEINQLTDEEIYNLDIRNLKAFMLNKSLIAKLNRHNIYLVNQLFDITDDNYRDFELRQCSYNEFKSAMEFHKLKPCNFPKETYQPIRFSLNEPIIIEPKKFTNTELILNSDILDAIHSINYLISFYKFKTLPILLPEEYLDFEECDLEEFGLLKNLEDDFTVGDLVKQSPQTLTLRGANENDLKKIFETLTNLGLTMAKHKEISEKTRIEELGLNKDDIDSLNDYGVYNVYELRTLSSKDYFLNPNFIGNKTFNNLKKELSAQKLSIVGYKKLIQDLEVKANVRDVGFSKESLEKIEQETKEDNLSCKDFKELLFKAPRFVSSDYLFDLSRNIKKKDTILQK